MTPRLCRLLGASLLVITLSWSARAVNVYTEPVGFITLHVTGTGGTVSNQFSFLGLGLSSITTARGVISAVNGTVLTDAGASWADNAFNGTNGAWYVELTSGAGAGITDDIVGTSGGSKTITTASDLSSFITAGATTYRIRQHWTLALLFGATNQAGLLAGNSIDQADEVIVFDPTGQTFTRYYYRTSAGWRTSADSTTDVSTNRLYFDRGVVIKRKLAAAVTIKLSGAVKLGQTSIPIDVGDNYVANVYPVTNITLQTSNLYTTNATTGLAPGTSAAAADNVLIWNGTGYDTYYYRTSAGWRSAADPFTDRGAVPLAVGGSVIVRRKAPRGGFDWVVAQPFAGP